MDGSRGQRRAWVSSDEEKDDDGSPLEDSEHLSSPKHPKIQRRSRNSVLSDVNNILDSHVSQNKGEKSKNSQPHNVLPTQLSKRPRIETSQQAVRASHWAQTAGTILSVRLKNFMCHQDFTYTPTERLNFLSGQNGSGKSAVLTAVMFALGGTARAANRGHSNKSLVRTGQAKAVAEVTLSNEGTNSYRQDVYGSKIIVERSISAVSGSGTYRLKDERGNVVVDRRTKEELERMLSSLMIEIDNPVVVMTQETAKTFLFKCDSSKLYSFVMKAAQIDRLESELQKVWEEMNTATNVQSEKETFLASLKSEVDHWEKKMKAIQSNEERKAKIKAKRAELAWAVVKCQEKNLEKRDKQVKLVESKIEKCNSTIEQWTVKKKELEDEIKTLEKDLDEQYEPLKQLDAEKDIANQEFKNYREEERKRRSEVKDMKSKELKTEMDIKRLEDAITKCMESGENAEKERERVKRKKLLESLMQRVEDYEHRMNTKSTDKMNFSHTLAKEIASEEEAKSSFVSLKTTISARRNELANLKKKRDRLYLLGEKMPKLVQMIEQNAGRFKCKPIGPLGSMIQLKPDVSHEQASAVESELKRMLNCFLVDNSDDLKTLQSLQKKCGISCPNIKTNFRTPLYDVSDGKCVSSFPTIYDLIEVSSPQVMNCLVDMKRIEQILIMPDELSAQRVLKSIETVPRNCYMVITHTLSQYFPAPNYRSYALDEKLSRVIILQASVEDLIASKEAELAEMEEDLKIKKKFHEETKEKCRNTREQLSAMDAEIQKLNSEIRSANLKIGELKNDESDMPADIKALEEDLDEHREKLSKLSAQSKELEERLKTTKDNYETSKLKFEDAKQKADDLSARLEEITRDIEAKRSEINKLVSEIKHYGRKMEEYESSLETIKKERDERKEKCDRHIEVAERLSKERIDTMASIGELEKEVSAIEEALKEREKLLEPKDVISNGLRKATDKYQHARQINESIRKQVKTLSTNFDQRRLFLTAYKANIDDQLKQQFSKYLEARNFSGFVTIDHTNRCLELAVCPYGSDLSEGRGRDMRTLSGGEKSFSTISLVLALWDIIQPPFRLLDEFDVFMDMVNRKTALSLITGYAKKTRKYQYVFLTPLSTEGVTVDEDVSILKIEKKN